MQSKDNIRFSDLFADTLNAHGLEYCWQYYVKQQGMAEWEFSFWSFSVTRNLKTVSII